MCGIYVMIAAADASSENMDEQVFEEVGGLLEHRGPDALGVTHLGRITMLHTRLAITGNDEAQPIVSADKQVHLVINGEIFNWKELEQEFGYKCIQSDCEIVIPLYEKYKMDVKKIFEHLEGQYSFVLYDSRNKHVLIGRDNIGITPLYYGTNTETNDIVVSSELKTMTISRNLVDDIKIFQPRTYVYSDIDKLSTAIPVKYMDYFNTDQDDRHLWGERAEMLNRLLTNSVRQQLTDLVRHGVDFGVLLSGGLDSSIIASLCVKNAKALGYGKRIKTFSIGIDSTVPDLVAARRVSEYLGTEHHEIYFSIEEGINSIESVVWHTETYDCTTIRASTPMYLLSKKIKELYPDIKVLFSGELADEMFCYLYGANAPSENAFQMETLNLVSNVHMFDCLRANKTCMANSIEVRVPFTDSKVVECVLTTPASMKMFGEGWDRMEKQLLRDAFEGYLPREILHRKKEQFSDGVSGFEKNNWIDALKDYAEEMYNDVQFTVQKSKYMYNAPETKEQLYYRQMFCKMFNPTSFGNTSELTVRTWEPKWSDTKDPSGRAQTFWTIN